MTHYCGHKCFSVCPHAQHIADTKFVSKTQNMFVISPRSILCQQQMFPSLCSMGTIMSNNVSATMCPCLPPPVGHRNWPFEMETLVIVSLFLLFSSYNASFSIGSVK